MAFATLNNASGRYQSYLLKIPLIAVICYESAQTRGNKKKNKKKFQNRSSTAQGKNLHAYIRREEAHVARACDVRHLRSRPTGPHQGRGGAAEGGEDGNHHRHHGLALAQGGRQDSGRRDHYHQGRTRPHARAHGRRERAFPGDDPRERAHRLSNRFTLEGGALDAFNLLDRKASDIDYLYASRLRAEPAGVDDIHFHPVEPRNLRLTLHYKF